jgi:hypothetical protein
VVPLLKLPTSTTRKILTDLDKGKAKVAVIKVTTNISELATVVIPSLILPQLTPGEFLTDLDQHGLDKGLFEDNIELAGRILSKIKREALAQSTIDKQSEVKDKCCFPWKKAEAILDFTSPCLFLSNPCSYNLLTIFDVSDVKSLDKILNLVECEKRLSETKELLILFAGAIKGFECWNRILDLIIYFNDRVFVLNAEHELTSKDQKEKLPDKVIQSFNENIIANLFTGAIDLKSKVEFKQKEIRSFGTSKTNLTSSSIVEEGCVLLHHIGRAYKKQYLTECLISVNDPEAKTMVDKFFAELPRRPYRQHNSCFRRRNNSDNATSSSSSMVDDQQRGRRRTIDKSYHY